MSARRLTLALVAWPTLALATPGPTVVIHDDLPSTLNPLFAETEADIRAQAPIFERLTRRVVLRATVGSRLLAPGPHDFDVEWLDGAVRLTLRDDVRWHDGQPITATDVCFTVQAMSRPSASSSDARRVARTLEGCTVEGDRTFVLHLQQGVSYDPGALSFPILPAHAFDGSDIPRDHPFGGAPLGSGPMAGRIDGEVVRYTRVEAAFGARDPGAASAAARGAGPPIPTLEHGEHAPARGSALAGFEVRSVADRGAALDALATGRAHGLVDVPPELLSRIPEGLVLRSYDPRVWWYVALDDGEGPLSDPRVRRAVDLSIDRDLLHDAFLPGDRGGRERMERITGPYVRQSACYDRGIRPAAASPADAATFMREAGAVMRRGRWRWEGRPIRWTLGVDGLVERALPGIGAAVAAQLVGAGFEIDVVALRTGARADVDLRLSRWVAGFDDDVSALFPALAREAAARSDPRDACLELHKLAAERRSALFLWSLGVQSVWRPEVRGALTPVDYYGEIGDWTVEP